MTKRLRIWRLSENCRGPLGNKGLKLVAWGQCRPKKTKLDCRAKPPSPKAVQDPFVKTPALNQNGSEEHLTTQGFSTTPRSGSSCGSLNAELGRRGFLDSSQGSSFKSLCQEFVNIYRYSSGWQKNAENSLTRVQA